MIERDLIHVDVAADSQEDVFRYLAKNVVAAGYAMGEQAVFQALGEREKEGSTGMMDGFAIPHAKSIAITKPGVAVLKLQKGVEWSSMDGLPIQSVIALFIPENEAGTTHLQLLSQLARLLMRDSFKEAFDRAETAEAIEELLYRELN